MCIIASCRLPMPGANTNDDADATNRRLNIRNLIALMTSKPSGPHTEGQHVDLAQLLTTPTATRRFEKWRTACLFELIKLCKYLLMHSVMTSSARYTGEVALEIKRETAKYS